MIKAEQILHFIRTMIEREFASDYTRLRQLPSTVTWRTIDYITSLNPGRRTLLFDAFAASGLRLLLPQVDSLNYLSTASQEEHQRFAEDFLCIPSFDGKYLSARLLRGILAAIGSDKTLGPLPQVSETVLGRAEAIHLTKSTEIRKVVKRLFTQRFGARTENFGGGNWNYSGEYQGRPFKVVIDYGGRNNQLHYWLFYEHKGTGIRAHMLTYEGLLGLGFGTWDFVTADNLQESIFLLCDLLTELLTIPERLILQNPTDG